LAVLLKVQVLLVAAVAVRVAVPTQLWLPTHPTLLLMAVKLLLLECLWRLFPL